MANVAVSVVLKISLEFIAFPADTTVVFLAKVRLKNENTDDMNGKGAIKEKRITSELINPSS